MRVLQALGGITYVKRAAVMADPSFYALARGRSTAPTRCAPTWTRHARALTVARSRDTSSSGLALGVTVHARNPDDPDALAVIVDANVELAALRRRHRHSPGTARPASRSPRIPRLSYVRELRGDTLGGARRDARSRHGRERVAFRPRDRGHIPRRPRAGPRSRSRCGSPVRARWEPPSRISCSPASAPRVRAAVRGDVGRAVGDLRALTRRLPVPAAVALLGDLQERRGDEAAAAKSFDLVRTIGMLQQWSGQVTDLETAVFEADHADDPASAAWAVDERGRRAEAARPDNVFVDDAVAWALYRSGDVAGRCRTSTARLRLGTPDTLLHFHAAVISAAAGVTDRAHAKIAKVMDGNPAFSFRYADDSACIGTAFGVRQ